MLSFKLCAFIIFIFATLPVTSHSCHQLASKFQLNLICNSDIPFFEYENHWFFLVHEGPHRFIMLVSPAASREYRILGLPLKKNPTLIHESDSMVSLYSLDNNYFSMASYVNQGSALIKSEILLWVIQHISLLDHKFHSGFVPLSPHNMFINVLTKKMVFLYIAPKLIDDNQVELSRDAFMIAELEKFNLWLDETIAGNEKQASKSVLQQSKEVTLNHRFQETLNTMKKSGLDYNVLIETLREILKSLLNIESSQHSTLLTLDDIPHHNQSYDQWMTKFYILLLILCIMLLVSLVVVYQCFKTSNSRRNNSDFASRVIQVNRSSVNTPTSQIDREKNDRSLYPSK